MKEFFESKTGQALLQNIKRIATALEKIAQCAEAYMAEDVRLAEERPKDKDTEPETSHES